MVWAIMSPLLALYLRDDYFLSDNGSQTVTLYCVISLAISIACFLVFRIQDRMSRYFSVHDALEVAKAVVLIGLMTCAVLFTFTRLEGISRSVPVIHALILGVGLVSSRAVVRISHVDRAGTNELRPRVDSEHIIIIGSNRLSALYIKMIDADHDNGRRVVAVIDDDPRKSGRLISGVRIVGPSQQLQPILDEFAVHGVQTDRVVVAGESDLLSEEALREVKGVCARRGISLDFLPQLLGISASKMSVASETHVQRSSPPDFVLPRYFNFKPYIEFVVALLLVAVATPLFILTAALALLDVGSSTLFWQQRVGRNGRTFLLRKFRTMKAPFDWQGLPIPEEDRLSGIGRLLRATSLDELPQLLNVLVGDMSLIGPRPLLPQDQPADPTVRLLVRPGITGWAQVNGARLLDAEQKDKFDGWYIRNASLLVDLRILIMSFQVILSGSRQVEASVATHPCPTEDTLRWQKYMSPDKRLGTNVAPSGHAYVQDGMSH
jgi:lipopolysaccharide/colanic/teichoic acid biosynthesis glycosyltransferase